MKHSPKNLFYLISSTLLIKQKIYGCILVSHPMPPWQPIWQHHNSWFPPALSKSCTFQTLSGNFNPSSSMICTCEALDCNPAMKAPLNHSYLFSSIDVLDQIQSHIHRTSLIQLELAYILNPFM